MLPDILTHSEVERLVDAFPRDDKGQVMLEAPDDNSHHDNSIQGRVLDHRALIEASVTGYLGRSCMKHPAAWDIGSVGSLGPIRIALIGH